VPLGGVTASAAVAAKQVIARLIVMGRNTRIEQS
jgi:hypothetical protein